MSYSRRASTTCTTTMVVWMLSRCVVVEGDSYLHYARHKQITDKGSFTTAYGTLPLEPVPWVLVTWSLLLECFVNCLWCALPGACALCCVASSWWTCVAFNLPKMWFSGWQNYISTHGIPVKREITSRSIFSDVPSAPATLATTPRSPNVAIVVL